MIFFDISVSDYLFFYNGYISLRAGCLYCAKRSRRSQCCANSGMGNSNLEGYFTTAKKGLQSPQIDQWHSWSTNCYMQGKVAITGAICEFLFVFLDSPKTTVQHVSSFLFLFLQSYSNICINSEIKLIHIALHYVYAFFIHLLYHFLTDWILIFLLS